MKNDNLEVRYLLSDTVEVVRVMHQDELAVLLLNDDVFLLGVNQSKGCSKRTYRKGKKNNGKNGKSQYKRVERISERT